MLAVYPQFETFWVLSFKKMTKHIIISFQGGVAQDYAKEINYKS